MTDNSEDELKSDAAGYADEVLCANWHPLVALLAEPRAREPKAVITDSDAEEFLARLYVSQQG